MHLSIFSRDVRCKLDVALQGKIRSLIQAVLRPTPNISGTGDTPRVVDFFRSSSPTPHPSQLKSPPLFARKGRTIQKTKHDKAIDSDGPAMDCIADIAPMLKHASAEVIEEEEGDMPGRHMQVVDQWCTWQISFSGIISISLCSQRFSLFPRHRPIAGTHRRAVSWMSCGIYLHLAHPQPR